MNKSIKPDHKKAFLKDLSPSTFKGETASTATPHVGDQLDLFTLGIDDKDNFLNSLILWDLIPKGKAYNSVSSQASLHRKTLDLKGKKFTVDIQPAQIQTVNEKTGVITTLFHFPREREDVICEVVRHLCTLDSRRIVVENEFTFMYVFTINDVFNELKRRNQQYSHSQIVDSLDILHKTNLTIWNADMSDKVSSTILPILNYNKNRKPGRKKAEDSYCQVSFHVVYAVGLLQNNFRPYQMDSSISSTLARHAYRFISAHFLNAGFNDLTQTDSVFEFDVDFLMISSIVAPGKTVAQNKVKVDKAMKELEKLGHIKRYSFVDIKHQGKIERSTCHVIASETFAKMIRASNYIQGNRLKKISQKALGIGKSKQI